MQGTFHRYALTSALTIKHSHITYLAFSSDDPGRSVLLTVFSTALFPFLHDRGKLLQKAQEIKALEHPYLLPILDLGIEEGQPFVAREYLPQGSLRDHLLNLRPGRLSLLAALTIVLQVGEALVYAHSRGVLHRNLKPGNVLFDADGHALLTDFSLVTGTDAIIRDQAIEEDAFCYLAPEQLVGICDARSDQYALGCLTYELITGQVPFVGQRLSSLMAHPSQAGPLPLSERVAGLPSALEAAVLKTLAKDPAERFVDCSQFLDVIRAVLFETVWEPALTSEQSQPSLHLKEESADVWQAHTSLEKQAAEALMSAPASSVYGSSTSMHGRTTSLFASRLDQSEPDTRQVVGGKRRPMVLALALLGVLASVISAVLLSGIAKPETSAPLSNKGTRGVFTEKKNLLSMQTTTPLVQVTPLPATQPPVPDTPLPAPQLPVQATPLPATPGPAPTSTPLPPAPVSYEAEAPENTLTGTAQILSCGSCSGGYRVGYLGLRYSGEGSLQFNNVNKASAGQYTLTVYYSNGASYARDEYIDINGGSTRVFSGSPTGSFCTVATVRLTVSLNAGNNTITFYNPQDYAPDIDRIVV